MVGEPLFNIICGLINESQLPPVVISGLIVGVLALTGVFLSFLLTFLGQYFLNRWRNRKMIRAVVQAICEELSISYRLLNSSSVTNTWMRFKDKEEFDRTWRKDKDTKYKPYYASHFPVLEDYLIMYRSNANLIGQINKSSILPGQIVYNYMLLQAIMGHFSINNTFLVQYRKTKDGEALSELRDLGPILRRECDLFNESVEKLFKMLKEEYNVENSADI